MAEAELNALKKLESNKTCVNCGAYNKFGHGNVCEKFHTFVCSNCKSAHQSFSHRVKSVTMSNWSQADVDALKEVNGGGNAVAERVWLGQWEASRLRKPQEGDHIDVYKRFIDKVYNDRAFYDENGTSHTSTSTGSTIARTSRRATVETTSAAQNLLDFGSPATSAPVAAAPTFDAFGSLPKANGASDDWGAFASAPASDGFGAFTSAAPTTTPSSFAASFDAFNASPTRAPAPVASTPASFDPFGPSSHTSPVPPPSSSTNFDPFGTTNAMPHASTSSSNFGFGHTTATPPPMMAPVTKNFSAFDALAAPPPNMAMSGFGTHSAMPRGPAMMPPGGMNMGMAPQGMMGGGYGARGPAPMGNQFMNQPQAVYNGGGRPTGSRDPFAGLGLP